MPKTSILVLQFYTRRPVCACGYIWVDGECEMLDSIGFTLNYLVIYAYLFQWKTANKENKI